MKFKSIAIPKETPGVSFVGIEDQVVPDQSMSLEEIIERFTRGEALPVQHDGTYDEDENNEVDLEKMKHADLVDQEEYRNSLEEIKEKYTQQEKVKENAAKAAKEKADKLAEEKRIRIEARKLAKRPPINP